MMAVVGLHAWIADRAESQRLLRDVRAATPESPADGDIPSWGRADTTTSTEY